MSKGRRNTRPRASSPAGVQVRLAARVAGYELAKKTAGKLASGFNKPGSRNPRNM